MYNKRTSSARRGRPFAAGKRSGGPNSRRSGGGGSFRGGARKRPKMGQYIDPSKFINKAESVKDAVVYTPEHKFSDFEISEDLKKNILAKGFDTPTPIQDKSIPQILKGNDVVGIANTGTGKTAAFLIPLIHKVLLNRKEEVLIMAPTRELAIQINDEFKLLTAGLKMSSVCTVGGTPLRPQLRDLKRGNNFIIGTPGRVKDLVERGSIKLKFFNTLVLDEADRMLDMGFVDDMRLVVKSMPKDRHTLFFSATLNREIEKLISEFLTNPTRISVKTGDTSKNVDQDVVRVRHDNKPDILHDLLIKEDFNKVLVFGATKHGVEKLSKDLVTRGFKSESIHGDKSHSQRQRALKKFKDEQVQILVATDVAARGLDIPNVSHVINYDLPQTYEDYVHRIGRTGRGDKQGKALTFIK